MLRAVWIGVCLLALTGYGYAQTSPPPGERSGLSNAEIRELLDAVKATATAARENVDHARVVPDLLFQILTKLEGSVWNRSEALLRIVYPSRYRMPAPGALRISPDGRGGPTPPQVPWLELEATASARAFLSRDYS
jgi:hypothetical protein